MQKEGIFITKYTIVVNLSNTSLSTKFYVPYVQILELIFIEGYYNVIQYWIKYNIL